MELHQKSVRRQYKTRTEEGAKIFALTNLSEQSRQSSVLDLCEEIYQLETRGHFAEAAELLTPYWAGFDAEEMELATLNKIETAQVLLRIGSVASALGSAEQVAGAQEKARDCLSLAEDIFADLDDAEGKAQCQNKIGVTYWRNGDLETAQIYFRESLFNAQSDESKAIACLNTAMIESLSFRYTSALEYYEKAYRYIGNISIFTEAKIRNGMGLVYKNIGKSLSESERAVYFDKAIIEFEGALVCYEQAGNNRSVILTRNNIGFLYYSNGLYEEAISVLEIAATQARLDGDKNNLSVVSDTLARALIARGDFKRGIEIAAQSVRYLESFENSNLLATALTTYGTALARSGEIREAKEAFTQAEKVAAYIQDFILAAAARLFALREMFSEYDPPQRFRTYLYIVKNLAGNQEKDISDALAEVTGKIEADIGSFPAAAENGTNKNRERLEPPPLSEPQILLLRQPFSLDDKLKTISREFMEAAVRQAKGNQSRAAALLGISRQTFVARIKKDFPDLLSWFTQTAAAEKKKKNSAAEKETVFAANSFPRYLSQSTVTAASDKEFALTEIQADYREIRRGDFLVIKLGAELKTNDYVIIGTQNGRRVKIGQLRKAETGYSLESADGKNFELSESAIKNTVIGTVAGYCCRADFRRYLADRENGKCSDLSCRALTN